MQVLVTGGTGVVGAGVLTQLLNRGHDVVLLSRHAAGEARQYPEGVKPFPADITDPSQLFGAADGCEAIVHIAGIVEESPPSLTYQSVNVAGTRHMVEEAQRAGIRHFIFISSLGADRGKSAYHKSKLQGELAVQQSALDWVIVRPGNVYGPGDQVISMLLKVVRSLPVVPVVGWGEQKFQPLWFEDLGRAIAQLVESSDHSRQILQVAGPEITTTREIIQKLGEITERRPVSIPVPTTVASVATWAAENFESIDKLLEWSGLPLPLSTSKLEMLLEENVIRPPSINALTEVLGITPTPLDTGLRRLAEELPELLPDDGFGPMERKRFEVEIIGAQRDATGLLQEIKTNLNEIMPIDFQAEPGGSDYVEPNATLTAALPGRGHIQVRAVDVKEKEMTFLTVEGHPLAGAVTFRAEDTGPEAIRFTIETRTRAANAVDYVAMTTVGATMQEANWRGVLTRAVELSGGESLEGIKLSSEQIPEVEAERITKHMRELANANMRREYAAH